MHDDDYEPIPDPTTKWRNDGAESEETRAAIFQARSAAFGLSSSEVEGMLRLEETERQQREDERRRGLEQRFDDSFVEFEAEPLGDPLTRWRDE